MAAGGVTKTGVGVDAEGREYIHGRHGGEWRHPGVDRFARQHAGYGEQWRHIRTGGRHFRGYDRGSEVAAQSR